MRDSRSYCGVLLDDNNRKPICRLRFNSETTKYLCVFDDDKQEIRHRIETVDDIYQHADSILHVIDVYEGTVTKVVENVEMGESV